METTIVDTEPGVATTFEIFNPPSLKFVKRAVHRLRKTYYTVTGGQLKLSTVQEAVARAYGHKDWFTMSRQIERDGYHQSRLDAELTESLLDVRHRYQVATLAALFDLPPRIAVKVTNEAQLTSVVAEREPQPQPKSCLQLASPQPGLTEILLTAYPFSIGSTGVPLPGWKHYVVVAAPTDNTALWVRVCDERDIAIEAEYLVRAVKELSGGSLALAYVPSQVGKQVPDLNGRLAAHGVKVSGGRPAIMAGRLRARLDSVLVFASMNLNDGEEVPSNEEVRALLHDPAGLVEIPDSKKQSRADFDIRRVFFAHELMQQIRDRRWQRGVKVPPSVMETEKGRRTEFWREDDGEIKLRGGRDSCFFRQS